MQRIVDEGWQRARKGIQTPKREKKVTVVEPMKYSENVSHVYLTPSRTIDDQEFIRSIKTTPDVKMSA